MAHGSKTAVYAAIVGNVLVTAAKFTAFLFSGSGAMLSEAIHSFADLGNQCLLAIGIKRSERPADMDHPYGYSREQFVWALMAGVGIFFLGCGVTVYHGIELLLHPGHLESMNLALAVLLVSFVIEGASGFIAVWSIKKSAGTTPFFQYVLHGTDSMGVAVLLEDSAALIGILTAIFGIVMVQVTGSVMWDAIATIVVGLLLGTVAIFIIVKNRDMLVGRRISTSEESAVLDIIQRDPLVEGIHDAKSLVLGPDKFRFKAEVDFDGRAIARKLMAGRDMAQVLDGLRSPSDLEAWLEGWSEEVVHEVGAEIDRIEAEIKAKVPGARHVDLEADG